MCKKILVISGSLNTQLLIFLTNFEDFSNWSTRKAAVKIWKLVRGQKHWLGLVFGMTNIFTRLFGPHLLLGTKFYMQYFFQPFIIIGFCYQKYTTFMLLFLGDQSIVWIFGNRLTPSSTFPLTIRWSESFPWKSQWRIWFFGIASPSTWGNVHQYQGQSRGLSGENLL